MEAAVAWMGAQQAIGATADGDVVLRTGTIHTPNGAPVAFPDGIAPGISANALGAKGDGVSDDTAFLQAAIDAAVAVNGIVNLAAGEYLTGPLTIGAAGSYNTCSIVGADFDGHYTTTASRRTVIKLKDGSNGTLFTVPASNASDVGPGPAKFENLWLKGNRSNQSGTSYAVDFLSHSATSNKQRSGFFKRVRIEEFRTGGIRGGTLRNAAILDQVVILNIGASSVGSALVLGSCSDWRFVSCDFGSTAGPVIQDSGAGAIFYSGCNFFTGGSHGYKADTATGDHFFVNCSFDRNARYGIYIDPSADAPFAFTNCRFTINSQESNGTYSDLYVNNCNSVVMTACMFERAGGSITAFPANHVEVAGTTNGVILQGCKFEATAASAITNDFTKTRVYSDVIRIPDGSAAAAAYAFGGAAGTGMYRTAAGNVGFAVGGSLQAVVVAAASAVNFVSQTGAASGSPPTVKGDGADTNIDLLLVGKGTGVLRFGTFTSNADAAVNGYVTIKDAGGVSRKLATIA